MARNTKAAVQQYRGTTDQHAAYTGPIGELTVDTDKLAVVVQDGATAGGITMAREDRKITSSSSGITLNGGASADLSADITLAVEVSGLTAELVAEDDQILSTDGDGKLTATVTLAYNTSTGKFDLIGSDGTTVISSVTVPSAVSMLQSVEFVTEDDEGNSGAFLHFIWLLDTGDTSEMYVDVSDLIDTYTAGDGIIISGHVVSVDVSGIISSDSGNVLTAGTDGNLLVATSAIEDIVADSVTVVSADTGNLISSGTDSGALLTQDGITEAVEAIVVAAVGDLVSTDSDNNLTTGSDSLLSVPADYGTMD